ncbi:hypothetical protein [Oleiharenicola lentus]|uniref:hypothetical protein n=1 Tax=Oleiharenicola lentus TaxID=2508720 RepID=UPI003F6815AD
MKRFAEKNESLWLLVASPLIWATHFMASYLTAAIWCAKFSTHDGSLSPVRSAIAAYTVIALAGIAWNAWSGWKHQRRLPPSGEQDADTPEGRHRFIGFATTLLAGISAIAVGFATFVIIFFKDCR